MKRVLKIIYLINLKSIINTSDAVKKRFFLSVCVTLLRFRRLNDI